MNNLSATHSGQHVSVLEEELIGEPFQRFQAVKATNLPAAVKCFSEFKSAISRRIQWEEKEVLPAFLQRVGGGLENTCDTLREEHREIIKLLDAIEAKLALANPATDAEEAALQRLLANHNHMEHRVVFPALESAHGQSAMSCPGSARVRSLRGRAGVVAACNRPPLVLGVIGNSGAVSFS
jgi:hypothetical protein